MTTRAPDITQTPAVAGCPERVARVTWPAGLGLPSAKCLLSVRRGDDGAPIIEIYMASPNVNVVIQPNLVVRQFGDDEAVQGPAADAVVTVPG